MVGLEKWLDILFPNYCVSCSQFSTDVLCSFCQRAIKPLDGFCLKCGKPLKSGCFYGCGNCIDKNLLFDKFISLYSFSTVQRIVHNFKFVGSLKAKRALERLLIKGISEHKEMSKWLSGFQYVIPIPMSWQRRFIREFNHAKLIAEILAEELDMEVLKNVLLRARHTPRQALLGRRERLKNIRGAFKLKKKVPERVVVVDDVATTMATVLEAAKVLKENGAKEVSVLVFARA
ncbi:competence protein ComFC [Thermosulfidibacter takaii ABI70S6]|uniref:Competence protein ComFC n=1 Tax=Thermosulfidibacter takaii (strain DSM 17441 / JCM 13301 / NBRC 103674 / ABI70S6) TaxID=1298851 RepID=A0A0S3QU81_THET7|nr:ComF family protein [Thermosulfidibacter takaii]BAT71897.1 competence protein ComFC [Thermosulfidibacter takaii ABI70S6]